MTKKIKPDQDKYPEYFVIQYPFDSVLNGRKGIIVNRSLKTGVVFEYKGEVSFNNYRRVINLKHLRPYHPKRTEQQIAEGRFKHLQELENSKKPLEVTTLSEIKALLNKIEVRLSVLEGQIIKPDDPTYWYMR